MKCASWGKWRSDTVIRSLGHIVRKICPRKTCPLRTGKGLFPTFSVTPARSAAAPFLLLSSRRHLGVHSVCRRRLFPEPPLVLCAIFSVDTCIHRSEVSADCRFSAIFLCPKQHRQQGGFGCPYSTAQKASVLRAQPHRSSVLEFSLPTHPSSCTSQLSSCSPEAPEQCPTWSRKSRLWAGSIGDVETTNSRGAEGLSMSFALRNWISVL